MKSAAKMKQAIEIVENPKTTASEKMLAIIVTELTQELRDLRYKVAKIEGKPLPPGSV